MVHLWQKNNVFPQEILHSLLQQDGSAGVSTGQAGAQQDYSEAANASFIAGSSAVILLV